VPAPADGFLANLYLLAQPLRFRLRWIGNERRKRLEPVNRRNGKMTTLREAATNSNHTLRHNVLLGMTTIFILVVAILVTMFLVAVISVG